jgi:hypothetical protein
MSSNFNDIISVLDAINKEVTIPVFVPSLNREVRFKNTNTGQQKSILKAAVDNPIFQTRFTIALYNLIQENCIEKDIVPSLTTIDSIAIALQIRMATSGPVFKVTQGNNTYTVNLQSVVDKLKLVQTPLPESVADAQFTVIVGAPLLVEQYNLEKQLREKSLNDQQIASTQLTDTIGDAFIGEVSKFIKSITVFHNNQEQQIDYKQLPFAKRHAILEKLPTTAVKGVLKYMEKYVSIQKDILTVTGTDTDTNDVTTDLILTIDTSLFVGS